MRREFCSPFFMSFVNFPHISLNRIHLDVGEWEWSEKSFTYLSNRSETKGGKLNNNAVTRLSSTSPSYPLVKVKCFVTLMKIEPSITGFDSRLPWRLISIDRHAFRFQSRSPKRHFLFIIPDPYPVNKVHFSISYGTWLHIVINFYYMFPP